MLLFFIYTYVTFDNAERVLLKLDLQCSLDVVKIIRAW